MALVTDQMQEKERNNEMMIEVLSQIVEFRNEESGLHVVHINALTRLLLENLVVKIDQYHLTPADCYLISTASAFHDIGKIGIDEKILNKPGRLTPEELIPHREAVKKILEGESGIFNPVLLECLVNAQGRIQRELGSQIISDMKFDCCPRISNFVEK